MSNPYDSEFWEAFAPQVPAFADLPQRPGNVEDAFFSINAFNSGIGAQMPEFPSVSHEIHHVSAKDGFQIPVWHFFKKKDIENSSAVYFMYGGGFLGGSVDVFKKIVQALVDATGVPVFAVNYRLSPKYQHPIPHDDCYTGFKWLHDNAKTFGVDSSRLAVYGESAGGNLAAGLALRARDEKLSPPIAKQILIYPMLDDRNVTAHPTHEHLFIWNHENNALGWKSLVGDSEPDAYAAPTRAESLRGLPSTYIDVGSLDIFVEENLNYAQRLIREDVEVEMHVYPGVPHQFEVFAPQTKNGKAVVERRGAIVRAL